MNRDPIAEHNRGITLRKAERFDEALDAFCRAAQWGSRAIETRIMQAHVLADLGRYDEAVAVYREVLARQPHRTELHEILARLLPQIGRADEAFDSYRAALAATPNTGILWVSAMATARALGNGAQQLEWANAAEARFGRDSLTGVFVASALSQLDRDEEAIAVLRPLIVADPDNGGLHANLAQSLVRTGDWRGAETAALAATEQAGDTQLGWPLLTVIWRLLGDPREEWLANYERLVNPVALEGVDWHRLRANLERRHLSREAPGDQSLRQGTQTPGILFDSPDLVIGELKQALRRGISDVLASLPRDPTHPFLRRNTRGVNFVGSWSVRLRSQGHHINHIHPAGWLSSALYVALPPEVGPDKGDAGALTFGEPDAALRAGLGPRRTIAPRVGTLVVFPSYFWHGTRPFTSESPRLTVAFDAVPA